LKCDHKGTYADDCIVNRVMAHKCYIVATNDKDLKRRIRKVCFCFPFSSVFFLLVLLSILFSCINSTYEKLTLVEFFFFTRYLVYPS